MKLETVEYAYVCTKCQQSYTQHFPVEWRVLAPPTAPICDECLLGDELNKENEWLKKQQN